MLEYFCQNDVANIDLNNRDPGTVRTLDRWMIYFSWTNIVRQNLAKQLLPLKVSFADFVKRLV